MSTGSPAAADVEHGRVAVIVTTRNSATTLTRCLESIKAQTYDDIEVIVVDNESTDETVSIASRLADLVLRAGPERSAQRNRGAEQATGEFLLFVDSDMVLTPNVVASAVASLRREGASAVVVPEETIGQGYWAACRALERRCYVGDETVEAARFFDRAAFFRHGGYDENLTGPEDWDLPARLRHNERIGRSDAAIHHDEGRLRLADHLRKKYYYGRTFGAYIRRHPSLAARQLIPIRPAFIRRWRILVSDPVHAIGVAFMKPAELVAGAAGLVSARLRITRKAAPTHQ